MRNGYTGRNIQAIAFDNIAEITLSQAPIARFFNMGTLVLNSKNEASLISLHRVNKSEFIKTCIDACRP